MVKTVETTSERLASDSLLRSAANVLQKITALQNVLLANALDSPNSQSLLDIIIRVNAREIKAATDKFFETLKVAVAKNNVDSIKFFVALINQRDPANDPQMKTDFIQQLFLHYKGKELQKILISLSANGLEWATQPNHDNSMLSKLFATNLTTRRVATLLKQLTNPEIHEWLRRHQPTKQPPRSLRRLRRPLKRQIVSAAKPRRLKHLRHKLPEGITDDELINKIVNYLKHKKRDPETIEFIEKGLCRGLAFIWAHACHASYLKVKKAKEEPHDLKWFWQSIATITDPDSNPENLNTETTKIFEEFIAHINYFQWPELFQIAQLDTKRLYRLASDEPLNQEYQYRQPGSEKQLRQQLDIILQNKHKIIMLSISAHAVAIYRNSTHILLFDSQDIIPTQWPLEKAAAMLAAHLCKNYYNETNPEIGIDCFGTGAAGTYPEIDLDYYYQSNSDKLNEVAYCSLAISLEFLFKQLLQKSDAVELFDALNLQINKGKLEDIKILIKDADAIGLNPEVALALGFRYMNAEVIDWVLHEYFGKLFEAEIEANKLAVQIIIYVSASPHTDPDFFIERLQKLPNFTMAKLAHLVLVNCSEKSLNAIIKHLNPKELNSLMLRALENRQITEAEIIANFASEDFPWLTNPDFKNQLFFFLTDQYCDYFELILHTVANKKQFLNDLYQNHHKIHVYTLLLTLETALAKKHDSVTELLATFIIKTKLDFAKHLFKRFDNPALKEILLALGKYGLDRDASLNLDKLIKSDADIKVASDLPWFQQPLRRCLRKALKNNNAQVFEFALANVTNKGEFLNRLLAGEYPLKASNILGALKVAVKKNHVTVIKFFADRINHRDPKMDHKRERQFIKKIFTTPGYGNIITALTENGLDLDAHPHNDTNIIEKVQRWTP